MKVKLPKSNRRIGLDFEKRVEQLLLTAGCEVCTPRSTSCILGRHNGVFVLHRDFFGLFDGIARVPAGASVCGMRFAEVSLVF